MHSITCTQQQPWGGGRRVHEGFALACAACCLPCQLHYGLHVRVSLTPTHPPPPPALSPFAGPRSEWARGALELSGLCSNSSSTTAAGCGRPKLAGRCRLGCGHRTGCLCNVRLSNATPVVRTCARYWARSGVCRDLRYGMSCLASRSGVSSES